MESTSLVYFFYLKNHVKRQCLQLLSLSSLQVKHNSLKTPLTETYVELNRKTKLITPQNRMVVIIILYYCVNTFNYIMLSGQQSGGKMLFRYHTGTAIFVHLKISITQLPAGFTIYLQKNHSAFCFNRQDSM